MGGDEPTTDREARTLLVVGTASHVGKSTVAAGFCRLLADRGVSVAPYKAQNMSNNARAAARATGDGWGEIGVSQYVQARAARTPATTDMNPVLLKPRGDGESQVVIGGDPRGHYAASEYYDDYWEEARTAAVDSHHRLAVEHDLVVAEGAGAAIEPNLSHRDLANIETARFADADLVLVADIERGGVFASIVGTLELLPADVREQVAGVVITKFRGDSEILDDGLAWLTDRTGVPVLGVLPYDDPGLPEEDSVALPAADERRVIGDDDGVSAESAVSVAVPRFPRVSNATDLEPLARVPGVRVVWVPLTASLDDADAVVLPGTKNTVDDLLACREAGFDEALAAFDGPVVGLCGGYQMLGERILNADVEGTGELETVEAFGRLPVETEFSAEKRVVATERKLDGAGPLAGGDGVVAGYEIHMGDTSETPNADADVARPLGPSSIALGDTLGTYLHGLFENPEARETFVDRVFAAADTGRPEADAEQPNPYDAAADLLRENLDLAPLGLAGGSGTADAAASVADRGGQR
ncbi:MAG: cobyric acid synthase [Halolamina sp.]